MKEDLYLNFGLATMKDVLLLLDTYPPLLQYQASRSGPEL